MRALRTLVLLVAILAAASCGGGGGGGGGAALVDDVGRMLRSLLHESPAVVKTQSSRALERLTSGEAVDAALAEGFCAGVTSLANDGQLPDGDDWEDFLVGFVETRLTGVSHDIVKDKAEQLDATAQLAQINGAAARKYVEGCLAR